jgi:hypothetical protein
MPLPNTRVIDPRWEQHHRPVANGGMTLRVQHLRPDVVGVRPEGADRTEFAPDALLYEGRGRVQHRQFDFASAKDQASRIVLAGQYVVSVPAEGPAAELGDLFKVVGVYEMADQGDADIVSETFIVVDMARGSLTWQRDYGVELQPKANTGDE